MMPDGYLLLFGFDWFGVEELPPWPWPLLGELGRSAGGRFGRSRRSTSSRRTALFESFAMMVIFLSGDFATGLCRMAEVPQDGLEGPFCSPSGVRSTLAFPSVGLIAR